MAEVLCPSGLKVEIRGLKGSEIDIFSDEKIAKVGKTFDHVLNNCCIDVIDPGPYQIQGKRISWKDVLICDRFVTLVEIRKLTYGPEFEFKIRCANASCRHDFFHEIDLRTLDIVDLDDSTIAKIAEGNNRFETEVGGKHYAFRLLYGYDEHALAEKVEEIKKKAFSVSMSRKIVEIDGSPVGIDKIVENMDIAEFNELSEAFDLYDGGIETNVEIECPRCDTRFDTRLPLESLEFWLKTKQRKQAKKEARKTRKVRRLG